MHNSVFTQTETTPCGFAYHLNPVPLAGSCWVLVQLTPVSPAVPYRSPSLNGEQGWCSDSYSCRPSSGWRTFVCHFLFLGPKITRFCCLLHYGRGLGTVLSPLLMCILHGHCLLASQTSCFLVNVTSGMFYSCKNCVSPVSCLHPFSASSWSVSVMFFAPVRRPEQLSPHTGFSGPVCLLASSEHFCL